MKYRYTRRRGVGVGRGRPFVALTSSTGCIYGEGVDLFGRRAPSRRVTAEGSAAEGA